MALTGVKFRAYPTLEQKKTLSQWMGCARFVWNAKCEEQEYFYRFKSKFLPIKTYPPLDQTYSQFKSQELSPWLFDCPSVILRNTAYTWKNTFSGFLKGNCGKPNKKRKGGTDSIWLTSELFQIDAKQLTIGSKKFDLGKLRFEAHRSFNNPKSIRIKKEKGRYYVSFCYEADESSTLVTPKEHLKQLSGSTRESLESSVVGIDRGVKIPAHAGDQAFDFLPAQKRHQHGEASKIKFQQKKLSRQQKGSNRREKTKLKLGRAHEKLANIRKEFCHQTSHKIVSDEATKAVVFEDLKTKQMTKRPKSKAIGPGKWAKNQASAKAGLNKAILQSAWNMLFLFCSYKAAKLGKAIFQVSASFTSQECADCSHIHPDNRQTQSEFVCGSCGHCDNADRNAAMVIKKRAINLMLDSGTELSAKGLLRPGRHRAWSQRKTKKANADLAMGIEASKMMDPVALAA